MSIPAARRTRSGSGRRKPDPSCGKLSLRVLLSSNRSEPSAVPSLLATGAFAIRPALQPRRIEAQVTQTMTASHLAPSSAMLEALRPPAASSGTPASNAPCAELVSSLEDVGRHAAAHHTAGAHETDLCISQRLQGC